MNGAVKRVAGNKRQKTFVFAVIGFVCNVIYSVYNVILGINMGSVWFFAMFGYYFLLGLMRFIAVSSELYLKDSKKYLIERSVGAFLIALGVLLSVITYISLKQRIATKFETITMITIAAFTFAKITIAIIKAVNDRKEKSAVIKAVNGISYAEVAVSLFTMQRSMLVSFEGMSNADALILNAFTGAGVFIFILMLGIFMIIKNK